MSANREVARLVLTIVPLMVVLGVVAFVAGGLPGLLGIVGGLVIAAAVFGWIVLVSWLVGDE